MKNTITSFPVFFFLFCTNCSLMAQVNLQNTGVLYSSNSSDILFINGNFTNTSAAALTNAGSLHVKQTLTNDQASMAIGTGTLYLNGSIAQAVNGSQPFKTYNLNTNNGAGITLNNNLNVSGTHTFAGGIIATSATPNYLVYEAGSSYAGDNDSRHVNGWVKKFGSTGFTFPVGDATWERTIAITGLSAASEFNAKYFTTTPNTTQVQAPIVSMDPNEYWALTKVTGGSASVAMNWNNSKVAFPNWVLSSITTANYNGSLWTDQGGTATGNVATTGAITSNSISSFNLLSFGSRFFIVPLALVSFTATPVNDYVHLEWKTMDENNVDNFSVERSDDGINYYPVIQLAARNSGNTELYSGNDYKPVNQVVYYRLRSTDKDGRYKLSSVIMIREENHTSQLALLTNPVHDQVILQAAQLNGLFEYKISMTNGQFVEKGKLLIDHSGQYSLPLVKNITTGVYILTISNAQKTYSFKILKN
jgi:hypothetical protein